MPNAAQKLSASPFTSAFRLFQKECSGFVFNRISSHRRVPVGAGSQLIRVRHAAARIPHGTNPTALLQLDFPMEPYAPRGICPAAALFASSCGTLMRCPPFSQSPYTFYNPSYHGPFYTAFNWSFIPTSCFLISLLGRGVSSRTSARSCVFLNATSFSSLILLSGYAPVLAPTQARERGSFAA